MAKLTANVLVTNPDNGEPVLLAEGSDLPEWATDLVGDHALDKDEKPARSSRAKADA